MYIINTNVLEILEQSTLDKDSHKIHTSKGDFLGQIKMTTQGSLYTSNAVMIEVEIRGDYRDLKREEISYTRDIASETVNNGTSETINYGSFVVLEVDYDTSSDKTTLICYDLMVKTQQEYDAELFTYPTTVHDLLLSLTSACDIELDINTYKGSNLPISTDVWVNASYTYRDILNHIAQLTTNTIKIKNDKLHLFEYEDTGVQLNRFANLKVGEDYGPTNILNISYEPQRDNVFSPTNANDIPKDKRKELSFVNNPIFMGNEQSYADTLLPQLTDMTYATSEFKLYHGGIFQVGDMVEVFNGTEYVKTLITQQVLDSSNVQSEYVSSVPFSFKSEYVVDTDIQRQGQTTYFIVDKQNGIIEGLVGRVDEVESQTASLRIEVDKIETQVSQVHLGNVIPNANGSDDYIGWQGQGRLLFINGLKFLNGMTYGMPAIPKEILSFSSQSGWEFFGSGELISSAGFIMRGSDYSFRAKINNFMPLIVRVYELTQDMSENGVRTFNFNQSQAYVQASFTPKTDTVFARLSLEFPSATPTNRVQIGEIMLNRGLPKDWFESASDALSYAKSTRTQLSDRITDTVTLVDKVSGDIHNASVDINAIDGVTTRGKSFRVQNSDGTETYMQVDDTGIIMQGDLRGGTVGKFDINDGTLEYTTPTYDRPYDQADLSEIVYILKNPGITLTDYQKYVFDINGDGNITVVDMAMIKSHLDGTSTISKPIKSRITIGTTDGRIQTTSLYGTDFTQVGASFIIQAERLAGMLVDADAVSTNSMSFNGQEVYVENGILKVRDF